MRWAQVGMEIEFVMSFHKCGGNVGDNVNIPLPKWVLKEAEAMGYSRVFYTDRCATCQNKPEKPKARKPKP